MVKSIRALQKAYEKRIASKFNGHKMPPIYLGPIKDPGTKAADEVRHTFIPKHRMKTNRPAKVNNKIIKWGDKENESRND